MKILDYVLILAVLATAVLSAANMKQINPPQALPILVTAGGQPAAGDTPSNVESPQPRAGAVPASPVIQVTVGLVCVLFGAIACFPLLSDKNVDR